MIIEEKTNEATGVKFDDRTLNLGSEDKIITSNKFTNIKTKAFKYLVYTLAGYGISALCTEVLADYDIGAAVKHGTDPVKKAFDDYWMTAVGLIGTYVAIVSEGDLKTKSYKTAGGVLVSAGVIQGISKLFLS